MSSRSVAAPARRQGTEQVVAALRAFYPIDVRVLPCQELPKAAYYPPRKRYRAERLLAYLNHRMPKDGWRILGLTDVDISTTKDPVADWGVMGLGELPGTATVISSFRCRKKARNAAHAIERLSKVAVHEIGHTLGLPHCPTRGCLMEDAMGKVVTTDASATSARAAGRWPSRTASPSPSSPRRPGWRGARHARLPCSLLVPASPGWAGGRDEARPSRGRPMPTRSRCASSSSATSCSTAGPGHIVTNGGDPFADVAAALGRRRPDHRQPGMRHRQEGHAVDKPYTFRGPAAALPLLKRYFSAVSLANNHSGDWGKQGFPDRARAAARDQAALLRRRRQRARGPQAARA